MIKKGEIELAIKLYEKRKNIGFTKQHVSFIEKKAKELGVPEGEVVRRVFDSYLKSKGLIKRGEI